MARIDEEQILVRFSKLIRDDEDPLARDVLTEDIRSAIESYVQTLVSIDILVEANIAVGGNSGITYNGGGAAGEADLYSLSAGAGAIIEGQSITITLSADAAVPAGNVVPYTVTGFTSAELNNQSLTGSFTVSGGTSDSETFTVVDSLGANGFRTLTLTLDNSPEDTISITVNPSV